MNYVYVNEDAISYLLKCHLCTKPFVDPVLTPDGERACRLCITNEKLLLNNSMADQQCSFFDKLVPLVDESILRDMLDNLLVKCPDCTEINILRKDFQQHLVTQCPKRIVSCEASDLKCPWNDCFDQYDEHVSRCTFELLRPILSETCQYQVQLQQYRKCSEEQQNEIKQLRKQIEQYEDRKCSEEQQNEIKQLRKQIEQYEDRIDQVQNELKTLVEPSSDQKARDEKFQNDIREIQEYFTEQNLRQNGLRNDIERLRVQYTQMDMLYKQMQQSKVDLPNQTSPSSNEVEKILQQIKEHLNQSEVQTKKCQEQTSIYENQIKQLHREDLRRKNEMLLVRQTLDQHEIQIRLLARKKCVVPSKTTLTIGGRLEELLETYRSKSEFDFDGKNFDHHDLEFICKTAILENACQTVRLEHNNITAKGAAMIADTLYGNTTLSELHLSNNVISDMGAHALAQALSINNYTLTWLEINANQITDEGAEYFAEMLKTNKTLVMLGLNFNRISDRGVQQLATSITCYNETLQWLHLASNKAITDASVNCLAQMFANSKTLQAVWLNDCSLSIDATTKLKKVVESNKKFILEI